MKEIILVVFVVVVSVAFFNFIKTLVDVIVEYSKEDDIDNDRNNDNGNISYT